MTLTFNEQHLISAHKNETDKQSTLWDTRSALMMSPAAGAGDVPQCIARALSPVTGSHVSTVCLCRAWLSVHEERKGGEGLGSSLSFPSNPHHPHLPLSGKFNRLTLRI